MRLFISHASEDKDAFVRPLAAALSRVPGLEVWYDEYELALGDSLPRSIDRGLNDCDYGIVILSPSFFAKEWPQKELDALIAREARGRKVILPIWHNVGHEFVSDKSPMLAERFAVKSSRGLNFVVTEIRRAVMKAAAPTEVEALMCIPMNRRSQAMRRRSQVTIRHHVLRRDGFRCTRCGSTSKAALEVCHIFPFRKGGSDSLENFRVLCASCHREVDRATA